MTGQAFIRQAILDILAVQVYELRRTDLIDCLNRLGCRDEKNRQITYKTIRPFLNDLEKDGHITANDRGFACAQGTGFDTFEQVVLKDRYKDVARQVLISMPLVKPQDEAYYHFTRIKEFYRAILMAVFSNGEFADPDLVYWSGKETAAFKKGKTPPLLSLFSRPFKPDLMGWPVFKIQWKVIGYILKDAHQALEPVPEAVRFGLGLLALGPCPEDINGLWDHLILTGQLNLHSIRLDDIKSQAPFRWCLQKAKQAMVRKDNQSALEYFKHALKKRPEQPCFKEDLDNLLFLTALLGSSRTQDWQTGLRLIRELKSAPVHCGAGLSGVADEMLRLFERQLGMAPVFNKFSGLFVGLSQDPLAVFFSYLITNWTYGSQADFPTQALEALKEKALASGYRWVAAEACSLLARMGIQKKANAGLADSLHDAAGTTSIVDLFEPVFEWKNALDIMTGLGRLKSGQQKTEPTGPPTEKNQDKRLIWQLDFQDNPNLQEISLTPMIQHKTKKGAWGKPKPMDLSRLFEKALHDNWLSPIDHRACAAITKEKQNKYDRFHQFAGHELNLEKALPALVGHPLIFTAQNMTTPVELIQGQPEIRMALHHEKIHINMVPRPQAIGVSLIKENPVRYRVVEFTMDQIAIARTMGNDHLVIPKSEMALVSRAIESIASLITVHTDVETRALNDLPEQAGSTLIHVHLTPLNQGIKMEALVRPQGDKGNYFTPGLGSRYLISQWDGQTVRTVRDLEAESAGMEKIIQACPTLESLKITTGEWLTQTLEQTLELLLELKECREKMILKWPRGERIYLRKQAGLSDMSLAIEQDREWFKASGTLTLDDHTRLDVSRLMALLETASGRFIPLDDGTFLAITRSLKARIEELNAYAIPHENGLVFSPLAAPALAELTGQVGHLQADRAWKTHCKNLNANISAKLPNAFTGELRDYQVTGFNWLSRLAHWGLGACLADDMGLGKTIQSLAAILNRADQGPSLVIAPLSVMDNWKTECRTFTPTMTPLVFGGTNRQAFLDNADAFDLIICSYGLLQTEAEKLSRVSWQTIVLDEAQAIKNRKTKRSRAAMTLNGHFRIITTGTPVENRLEELWTLFHFLNPGLLGPYKQFKQKFVLPIEGQKDKTASRRLRKLIRPFLLRRNKSEVLKELPEKTEIVLQVEMNRDESVLYEAQRLKSLENIEQSKGPLNQKHFRILAELTRLRQLCCNPALILPDTGIESSKLKVFMDTVRELLANHHRALVFSQFTGHLEILTQALSREGISFLYLDGATPAKQRKERIQNFQNGHGDLFLISLKAGGTGLNLTAADYVIHMDPWWNPAVEDQASDRAHRIGQTRPVTVYRLVVKDTIEERIVDLHREKRHLAESLLAGSETAGALSASELIKLIQG